MLIHQIRLIPFSHFDNVEQWNPSVLDSKPPKMRHPRAKKLDLDDEILLNLMVKYCK